MTSVAGRTVLVLHAHPDDEAIFTGITMRRLADAGARVVLVTATLGELGEVLVPLGPGETTGQRRLAELERAAELLGVARLAVLGWRDSGLPGMADNVHPDALAAADQQRIARRLAQLVDEERAEAVLHYDAHGIYGHPDHVAVNRIGAAAAQLAGVSAYEATVDARHLDPATRGHLIHGAARAAGTHYGLAPEEIELVVRAQPSELAAKHAAIVAHASQIRPEWLAAPSFPEAYGLEWFVRAGAATVVDEIAGDQETVDAAMATPAVS